MASVEDPRVDSDEEEDDVDDEPPPDFFKDRSNVKARGSVSAEAYGEWNTKAAFVAPVIPKSAEQTQRLNDCLCRSFMFSGLEDADMAKVIGAMSEVQCQPGQRIINQGDNGDCLYVVETGQFGCYIQTDGGEICVKNCEASDVFGELALLYNAPRAASVQSVDTSVVWRLDRDTFNNIVKDSAQRKRARHEEFLAQVPLLADMPPHERSALADVLRSEKFESGQAIMTQGEPGKRFYIVEEGQAEALKDGVHAMSYGPGDYFGELALLRNQTRVATVVSKSPLRVLSLDSAGFKRLLNAELLEQLAAKYT